MRPARNVVVLDRDGTIVEDRHYLDNPAGLQFLPGAAEGLRMLHERGCRLVVITNQSGIGRGLFSVTQLEQIHDRLRLMTSAIGAPLEAIYYCPHVPADRCVCRKPATELLTQATISLGFAMSSVVVIGDKDSDIEFGRRVQAPTILIDGASSANPRDASFVVPDLVSAARIVTEQLNG